MPTCFSEFGIGLLTEDKVIELADDYAFHKARTIGVLKKLNNEAILKTFKEANRQSKRLKKRNQSAAMNRTPGVRQYGIQTTKSSYFPGQSESGCLNESDQQERNQKR